MRCLAAGRPNSGSSRMAEAWRGEDLGDEGLELLEVVGVGGGAALLGERLLEGAALVHGGGGDDAALVGDGFQSGEFTWGRLRHVRWSPEFKVESLRGSFYTVKVTFGILWRLSVL